MTTYLCLLLSITCLAIGRRSDISVEDDYIHVFSLRYGDDIVSFDEKHFTDFLHCLCDEPIQACHATSERNKTEYRVVSTSRAYYDKADKVPKSRIICSVKKGKGDQILFQCLPSESTCMVRLEINSPYLLENMCLSTCVDLDWNGAAAINLTYADTGYVALKTCDHACQNRRVISRGKSITPEVLNVSPQITAFTRNDITTETIPSTGSTRMTSGKNRSLHTTTKSAMVKASNEVAKTPEFNYHLVAAASVLVVLGSLLAFIIFEVRRRRNIQAAKSTGEATDNCTSDVKGTERDVVCFFFNEGGGQIDESERQSASMQL
ncbi:hypothetical protein Btru_055638 [Bulinus truncatus]|nr:hypothetical protein Btru_055638 [Bulinus truncatus]